jgi:anaerobic magnesium-protoporphyrin IX monomethyl ester cyclase
MAYKPSLADFLYTNADSNVDVMYRELMRGQDQTPESTDSAKPRFTLIVGPSPFSMPRGWEFFLTSPYEGASYISTVLHNAGFPVRIVDVRYTPDPMAAALQQIRQGTDVLGICTFEDNFPWCQELMATVKRESPDVPIICGGSLVTSVPQIFMSDTTCDVAVISEGEITILELMEKYAKGEWDTASLEMVRGIWFREPEGRVRATPPRGQMMDLNALPKMNLDLWPQSQGPKGLQKQIISSYSRGCKMDCSFCYRTTPQERAKSPEKLDEELSELKSKHDIDFIFFVDLTFTSHKKQTLEIMDVIKKHDIRWTCLTRCADMDKERADAMRDSGCDIALFGVESLGSQVLKEARKGNTENITIRAQRTVEDAGVRFGGLTIVGLQNETEESLDHMCQWAEENNHITRVKYLSLMPGTSVYNDGVRDGFLKSEIDHLNWLSIEQALVEDEFINLNKLPEQVMRTAYQRIYDAYCPGPVMDFDHYPDHFEFHHPNAEDGQDHCTDYAGKEWRAGHSSATAYLVPGSERFTLADAGVPGSVELGASLMPCGAAKLEPVPAK